VNVNIVFPVSLCIPNQLYLALPMLAGALKRAGHRARGIDLNVLAADLFCDDRRARRFLEKLRGDVKYCLELGDLGTAEAIRSTLDANEGLLCQAQGFKELLRSPRFYDQAAFKRAFWGVVDVMGFYYQLDPVISPFRQDFGADVLAHEQRAGWTPIVDLYEERLLDEVLTGDPGMLAICVAFPEQSFEAVRLARLARRRRPDLHIAFGGPLVALHADKWLRDGWIFEFADSVCVGDGETAICELADAVEGKRGLDTVRNVALGKRGGPVSRPSTLYSERLDDLPLADYGAVDTGLYFTPKPIYPLMLSRGCYWGKCTFCSIGWRENFRVASPKKMREDVVDLVRTHGARYLRIDDSSLPPKAARVFAKIVQEEKLDIGWVGALKFDKYCLDTEFLRELHAGGCRSLMMGLETTNQGVIDLMEKGFEAKDALTMIRNVRAAGISAEILWFIGFPTQTRADVLETANFLFDHRQDYGLTAFVGDYILHPDTEVFDRPADFGVTITGITNDTCQYRVDKGMQPEEAQHLKRLLACNNNRTLVCNTSHLPHLVENGIDLSGLERPMAIPKEAVDYCLQGSAAGGIA
jgi:hypothetical protein